MSFCQDAETTKKYSCSVAGIEDNHFSNYISLIFLIRLFLLSRPINLRKVIAILICIAYAICSTADGSGAFTVTSTASTVTPSTGTYGVSANHMLPNGSAGGGDVTLTIGNNTTNAQITDPGACLPGDCGGIDWNLPASKSSITATDLFSLKSECGVSNGTIDILDCSGTVSIASARCDHSPETAKIAIALRPGSPIFKRHFQ